MDDATLARLEHENMLCWLGLAMGQVPGSVVRLRDGVGIFGTGLPAPFFNQVVTDDGAAADDVAAAVAMLRALDIPRPPGSRFCVVLRADQDAHLRPLMADLGLTVDDAPLPGMALHPLPPTLVTTAPSLEIRTVEDAASLRDHAIVAGHGFEVPEPVALAFIGERLWAREGARVYTGYADGRPVCSGFSVQTGETLGIFTIATEPDARGRGFGAAMTSRLIADGAAAGCTVAVLQASAMGRPIYERIGFRLVQPYEIWVG
jgi:GNAT superfamily N-acetyltransferase